MPELPDLEVIRERLAVRVIGLQIVSAAGLRPIIVRDLMGGDSGDLAGRSTTAIGRRGKFLQPSPYLRRDRPPRRSLRGRPPEGAACLRTGAGVAPDGTTGACSICW